MKDVAALAGVSIKTVSRVVNHEPGVSTAVRTKVMAAAQRLDYRHNLAASALRRSSGRTGMIGALVQDIGNSYSATLVRGLEEAARQRGTAILTASINEDTDREEELVHDLVTRRVDGLILVPSSEDQEYLASDLRAGMPCVFVDRKPRGVEADSVTVDNVAGARIATSHLLAHGHRRIAIVSDAEQIMTAAERLAGYEEAHREAGAPIDPALRITGVRTEYAAERAAIALLTLPDPPTAVFAARNVIGVGVCRALAATGQRRSIALVGFDDFPMADLVDPPLTVIRQDVARLAQAATERLFARIDGDSSPPEHLVFDPILIERGSGEIRPPAGV